MSATLIRRRSGTTGDREYVWVRVEAAARIGSGGSLVEGWGLRDHHDRLARTEAGLPRIWGTIEGALAGAEEVETWA